MSQSTGTVFVISAPSGAGKTSLVNALLERVSGLELSVSHTTRRAREGEVDGQHYFFVDAEEFQREIDAGNMLEHAEVFGNLYGTSARFVRERTSAGADVVLEIDWQGAALARASLAQLVSVMILPPSRAALERRLRARGKDSDDVIRHRLTKAREEMSQAANFDYVIINDDFEEAAEELAAIVKAERARAQRRLADAASTYRQLMA